MWKAFLALAMVLLLFPVASHGQVTDKEPTLGIKLTNTQPFSYKDDEGKTVVIGEVQNTKNFPITAVKVWTGFFSDTSGQLLESTTGNTILDVIPPQGTSPFMITSKASNPAITSVSVNLLGFNSSPQKQQSLTIKPGTLQIGDNFSLSGNITNNGALESANTKIHFIAYDSFFPPRVVQIETIQLNAIPPSSTDVFEFDAKLNAKASNFKLVAESNNYLSQITPVQQVSLDALTRLVTINGVSLRGADDSPIMASEVFVGSDVFIQSDISIQYATSQKISEQSYVYYVQVKSSGEQPVVEFIGQAEGSFQTSSQQIPKIKWTPQNEGLFFIETFVWDENDVAIASQGPITLVHVKP